MKCKRCGKRHSEVECALAGAGLERKSTQPPRAQAMPAEDVERLIKQAGGRRGKRAGPSQKPKGRQQWRR